MGVRSASRIDVKTGTAGDAWSAAIPFDFATWLVSLECWNNNMEVQLSYDGTTWLDAFEIDIDRPFMPPFQARSFRIRNKTAGYNSIYQSAGID